MDPSIESILALTRSSTPTSQQSSLMVDATSNAQSSTQASTPPAMADSQSVISMTPNEEGNTSKVPESAVATPSEAEITKPEEGGRERRRRSNVPTYNLKVLSGTAVHSPFAKNGVRKTTRARLPEHHIERVPRVRRSTGNMAGTSANNSNTNQPNAFRPELVPRPKTSDEISREIALRALFGRQVPPELLSQSVSPQPVPRPQLFQSQPTQPLPRPQLPAPPPPPQIQHIQTPHVITPNRGRAKANLSKVVQNRKDVHGEDQHDFQDDHQNDNQDNSNQNEFEDESASERSESESERESESEIESESEDADVEERPKRAKRAKRTKKQQANRRQSTRLLGVQVEPLAKQVLGKRSRAVFSKDIKSKRELLRLLDTKEYAGIDDKPVIHEVWSNGKLVVPEKARKKQRGSASVPAPPPPPPPTDDLELVKEIAPVLKTKVKRVKKVWLEQGLYVGVHDSSRDWFGKMTEEQKRNTANLPTYKPTGFMPLPMWHMQRIFNTGRNFKLPYDVCNPLAPGQPKPDGWKALISHRKNHLVGDAQQLWRDKYQNDDSKCICSKNDGCGEGCHNREMMYECDDTNCNVGEEHCTNRSWAELEKRRDPKISNIYTIGVEVFKTEDRGFGVRANRCFKPGQIIVEYTGEIITEEECDRRMNEEYKNKSCYYLMSYEQNMILDATRGSIARFVNHSCNPNCNMVKWVVKGKPRIALFALDRPIMTGEELTYDYNFNPFAANNVQECRCGSKNCRGIVGPRPKGPQDKAKLELVKTAIKKAGGSTTKRKFKELMGQGDNDSEDDAPSPKKKKVGAPKPAAAPKPPAKKMTAKGFARAVKARTKTAVKKVLGRGGVPRQPQRVLPKRVLPAKAPPAPEPEPPKPKRGRPFKPKRGRPRIHPITPDVKKTMSKHGKQKLTGSDGNRNKAAETPSPTSSSSKSSKPSTKGKAKAKETPQETSQNSFSGIATSVSTSRPSSSAGFPHYPNLGEARIGNDEERDAFVSGTIRSIVP